MTGSYSSCIVICFDINKAHLTHCSHYNVIMYKQQFLSRMVPKRAQTTNPRQLFHMGMHKVSQFKQDVTCPSTLQKQISFANDKINILWVGKGLRTRPKQHCNTKDFLYRAIPKTIQAQCASQYTLSNIQ